MNNKRASQKRLHDKLTNRIRDWIVLGVIIRIQTFLGRGVHSVKMLRKKSLNLDTQ